jgi:zinc D-Ala-D-Ala carboxypeptidase
MGDISNHFNKSEMICKHCGAYKEMDPALLKGLDTLRDIINQPLVLNSAYRCPKHPLEVNKKTKGQHTMCKAADIRIPNTITKKVFLILILRIPEFKGIGLPTHSNYIHVDTRNKPARWGYDINNKQIAYDKALKSI